MNEILSNKMTRSEIMKKLWQDPKYRKNMSDKHKGIKLLEDHKQKISNALKGKMPKNIKQIAGWNKGLKMPKNTEEKNGQWRGDVASYSAKHHWVQHKFGKANSCELCKNKNAKRYEWANVSRTYKRERSDWVQLCKSCHCIVDIHNLDINKEIMNNNSKYKDVYEIKCIVCSKKRKVKPYLVNTQRYCSHSCYSYSKRKVNNNEMAMV